MSNHSIITLITYLLLITVKLLKIDNKSKTDLFVEHHLITHKIILIVYTDTYLCKL